MDGICAVNKPIGPTSNDVLEMIRKKTGVKKVGHAGTLDPLAQGVLVIGLGRDATKKLQIFVNKEKEYLAIIRLGVNSTTDDEEGEKTSKTKNIQPKTREINQAVNKFVGVISQVPPQYSAVKIKGRAAYKYARSGKKVRLKARRVEIKEIEVLGYQWPELKLRIVTGPGAYIRSLARDIGIKLGTGGYLKSLIRTRVGDYEIGESGAPEQLINKLIRAKSDTSQHF